MKSLRRADGPSPQRQKFFKLAHQDQRCRMSPAALRAGDFSAEPGGEAHQSPGGAGTVARDSWPRTSQDGDGARGIEPKRIETNRRPFFSKQNFSKKV